MNMVRKIRFPKKKWITDRYYSLHSKYIKKTGSIQQEKKRLKKRGYNARIVKSGGLYALYYGFRKKRKR